jgi:hypothetical protein
LRFADNSTLSGLIGLQGLQPGGETIESPISFLHDVAVEEVRHNVLYAHLTPQSRIPKVRGYFLAVQAIRHQRDANTAIAGSGDAPEKPRSPYVFDI